MGYFPDLPSETNLSDLFKAFPQKGVGHLLRYHDAVLRAPSPLSIAQRELIAAYVSGINECGFCYNSHTFYAEQYGIDFEIFEGMMKDLETSAVEDKMKPVLAYAGKLTKAPATVVQGDVDAIFDAGWGAEALNDIILVTAIFNFMNRLILGAGITDFADDYDARKARIRKMPLEKRAEFNQKHLGNDHYASYGRSIGVIED
jgi:uncharacterized peroxidase-related enzyme